MVLSVCAARSLAVAASLIEKAQSAADEPECAILDGIADPVLISARPRRAFEADLMRTKILQYDDIVGSKCSPSHQSESTWRWTENYGLLRRVQLSD